MSLQSNVITIKEGYSFTEELGQYKADCSISHVSSHGKQILVDTGGPWNKQLLENFAKDKYIDWVVCTHGHSDHIGNINNFPCAHIIVSYDICFGDTYLANNLKEGVPYVLTDDVSVIATPGHTGSDVSVVVKNTPKGTIIIAGDLFECEADLEDSSIWLENSENPELQRINREKVLNIADYIIPGHGPIFQVPLKFKTKK